MAGMLARVLMANSAGLYPPSRTTNGTRRKRRTKTVKRARTSSARKNRKARTKTVRKARMVKGSAAARRYMAKIRKLRKR